MKKFLKESWFVIILVIGLIVELCVIGQGLYAKGNKTPEKFDIYSYKMSENQALNARFILGSGKIKGSTEQEYLVYVATEDGGMLLKAFDAKRTVIYKDLEEGEQPYIEYELFDGGNLRTASMHLPENTVIEDIDSEMTVIEEGE